MLVERCAPEPGLQQDQSRGQQQQQWTYLLAWVACPSCVVPPALLVQGLLIRRLLLLLLLVLHRHSQQIAAQGCPCAAYHAALRQ
jgi:hypothetical protein